LRFLLFCKRVLRAVAGGRFSPIHLIRETRIFLFCRDLI
jgi:hypothetical protein